MKNILAKLIALTKRKKKEVDFCIVSITRKRSDTEKLVQEELAKQRLINWHPLEWNLIED